MYNANNHPQQEKLDKAIALCLAKTVKELQVISNIYNVDAKSLANQFEDCFRMFKNQTFTKE